MRWLKKTGMFLLMTGAAIFFVQAAGSYLVAELSRLEDVGYPVEPKIEEKVVKQMMLQLDAQEYYTIQIGSYQNLADGQARINALAKMGYRAFVSQGPPYQLWIGCTGTEPVLDHLPAELLAVGEDVFVQKLILNRTVFQFPAESAELQELAVLLSSYDVVLKHSLKLFQDFQYESCSEENWIAMITQVLDELQLIDVSADSFLLNAQEEVVVSSLLDLLEITEDYCESLQLIIEKKNTKAVLLAQSCLLELIMQYHILMEQASVKVSV